ncbi:MAG: type I methionyl aminopeptidase [Chitinophagaceae bacterium]|nr:type I methionyl aminopeptidase [Chitinophagaceae bacterium]
MIIYKTREQAELIRESCKIVNDAIAEAAKMLVAGITTMQLDRRIEEYIRDCGALPSFKGYSGYPFASCISVNDAVVHGFPNDVPLKEGDIVSVDVGAFKNNYHGDSAYTFILGDTDEKVKQLVRTTKESLYLGIEKAVAGNRIGDISHAVQQHTERLFGYGVVRELVGHGLGNDLHEDPQVPNYGKRGSGPVMKEGLVIAIEPMINLGKKDVVTASDGWTVLTRDGKPSAHFEHTVYVQKVKADILSSFETIEAAEKGNLNLFS